MTVVTRAQAIRLMLENVIEFALTYVDDPNEDQRRKHSDPNAASFVKLKDSKSVAVTPQILVEYEGGGTPTQTGIYNQIRSPSFGILMSCRDQIEAIDLGDTTWNAFMEDTNQFFLNAKMYRSPNSFLSELTEYPHEDMDGKWYSKFSITFQFLHYK